ncbi:MAG: class I SAM-dependent methyltransferase [Candidatus Sumerlaeaceae bacterium]
MTPRQLPIPRGSRVLEIGSGGRPHARSTVLLDRFLADDSQREGRRLVRDGRALVLADGQALPFRDKAFDYCICMHVLEHVEDPPAMLREMERVARAGYIETPTELHDWLFAVPPYTTIHKWYVNANGGELELTLKRAELAEHRFAHLLDHLRREDAFLERWMEKRPGLFTTQFFWNGEIRWRMSDGSPYEQVTTDEMARNFVQGRPTRADTFWGSGSWGLKRWLYSGLVHPAWRKAAKRLLGRS